MYIIFNNDGSVFAQEQANYVMQGSNKVNQVFVGFVDNQYEKWSCSGFFTLPNSTTATIQATRENFDFRNKQYKGYVITLTDLITRYSGDLRLSINITNNETQILYTYPITIIVNQTGYPLDGYWDNAITIAQYNDYMAQLSQKADYEYVDNLFDSVEIDTSNLCTLDTDQTIYGVKTFAQRIKLGSGNTAISITNEDGKSLHIIDASGLGYTYIEAGYPKIKTYNPLDGINEYDLRRFATLNDIEDLYDLIFDNIIVPVEETLKGVNLFIPSTFTLDDNLQHELIENTDLDIVEIKGNTWVKNQILTLINATFTENGITSTHNINGTIKYEGTATVENTACDFITGAINKNNLIVGHKYALLFNIVGDVKSTKYYIEGFGGSYTPIRDGIFTANSISMYGRVIAKLGETLNFTMKPQVIDLTQMFGAGREPTTIDEFNKLTANVEFYNTNEVDLGTLTFGAAGESETKIRVSCTSLSTLKEGGEMSVNKKLTVVKTAIGIDGEQVNIISCNTYLNYIYCLFDKAEIGYDGTNLDTCLANYLSGVILKYETNETYVEPTIINTSITELKSYGEYASVDLSTLDYTQISNGVFKSISLRYLIKSTTGYREKPHIICDKFKVDTPANLEGSNPPNMSISIGGDGYSVLINDTALQGKTNEEVKSMLSGVILYYQPQDFTQANLLGTYPLSIPTLYGIGTAQDSVNKYGYVKRIGSYTFTGNEYVSTINTDTSGVSILINLSAYSNANGLNKNNNIIAGLETLTYQSATYTKPNSFYFDGVRLIVNMGKSTQEETLAELVGKTIYYELATPQTNETDLNLPQDIKFERNGVIATGSLTATDTTINVNVKDWGK